MGMARGKEKESLLCEIRGNVRHLATSDFGTEVLQTCLELMCPKEVSFIARELSGVASIMAHSEAGLAVLCRILEYLPFRYTGPLLQELHMSLLQLSCHPCASHIVSHLIDYGPVPYGYQISLTLSTYSDCLSRYPPALPLLKKAKLYLDEEAR